MNKTELIEQTLEEKVREILEPLGTRISDLNVSDQRIEFHAGVNRYSITSDTITREGHEFTLNEYKESRLNEDFRQCLPKVAALLTEQPEQTLEEMVREILEPWHDLTISYIHDDEVSLCSESRQYWITATNVSYDHHCQTIEDYTRNSRYGQPFSKVAKLLTARSTKPSYSDLEQRVEELEKDNKRLAGDYNEVYDECEEAKKRHRESRKLMERYQEETLKAKQKYDNLLTSYQRECERSTGFQDLLKKAERENASLLDKFGPIDQAEQQVAEVETRFQKLAKRAERIADLLIQLNEEIL